MRKNIKKAETQENAAGGVAVKTGKTTLQKQYIFIIIGLAIALLFAVFYFFIYPMIQTQTAEVTYTYDGEYYDGSTLYIVGPHKRAEMTKIEVKNQNGSYVLNGKGSAAGRTFTLEGGEGVKLDEYALAGVVVSAGQPVAIAADSKNYRADEYATKEDLAKYGLDEASDPAWFRVTLEDGTAYRIFIGDALPTGKSHYAYLEDETRRNVVTNEDGTTSSYYIVYVLDTTSSATLLYDKTGLVSPVVGDYIGNGVSYLSNFEIYREINGERKLIIKIGANENTETATSAAYAIEYPRGYLINDMDFESVVLTALTYIEAKAVVALGDEVYDPAVYEQYGLDLDPERIEAGTDENYIKFSFACRNNNGEPYSNTLYISEKKLLPDGTECYYMYVPEQYEIVMMDAAAFDFVSWPVTGYTSDRLFFEAIGSLDYFSILSADKKTDVRFTLTGNSFTYHVDVENALGTTTIKDGAGKDLVFDVEYEKTKFDTNFTGPFEEFRNLYYVLITRMIDTSEDVREIPEEQEPVLRIEAQTIMRDRNSQYYKYKGDTKVIENGSYVTVQYIGGHVVVKNLTGTSANGKTLTYDKAYYNEQTGKYFVKEKDTADGETKPRAYTYNDNNEVVPTYLSLTNATAEYSVTTYEYDFYDMYEERVDANGNVTKTINQTYMLVVPNSVTRTYRIEADGSRTLLSEDKVEAEKMGSCIRRASVEKLISDTAKLLAGEPIDKWAVD
ncbi:MAG: hypothetical protein E7608_06770 [Ruminococcaceae bacterium]|nr:hypothetical protein [Oscillospiraceae bacterium]